MGAVKKKLTLSAKSKIVRILMIFIVPLIILLISYNWYSIDMINDNSVEYGKNILEIYAQPMKNELRITENYFVNIMSGDVSFQTLIYAKTPEEVHFELIEVNKKVKTIYSTALSMAGHIVYHIDTDQVKEYYNYTYSPIAKNEFKNILRENFAGSDSDRKVGWVVCEVENQFYLIRFFYLKNACLMGIYDLSRTDVPQMYQDSDPDSFVFFTDNSRQPITSVKRVDSLGIELDSEFYESYTVLGSKQRYLIVEKELSDLGLYMVYVTPYYGWMSSSRMPVFFLLFSVMIVVLLAYCVMLIRRSYIIPLQSMVDTMITVKAGDMGNRMKVDYEISEFQVAVKTFNDMLDEIQNLKISGYEQELEIQRATMRYLQIQIRPHFILNCLKNVYSLAQDERYKDIQETLIVLSQYLRFVLKDDMMLVTVEEEIKNVENYIFLQQMSASDSIKCEYLVGEDTLPYMLPPLSILTFVENSVKHGQRIGKKFILSIKVKINADFLSIMILDNGNGFSEEDLEYLNNKTDFSYGKQHIGIQNVLHRFSIIYHGKSEVVFSNAGGACIKIFIPLIDTGNSGETYPPKLHCLKQEEDNR